MSLASVASATPGRPARAAERVPRHLLRPVGPPARRRRPRLLYAIIAVCGALAIAAAQMGLSIAMTQGVYQERALAGQIRDLRWQTQSLTDEITGLSSPQYLAANASALGMVINEAPSYLRLSDGLVLGTASAAGANSSVDAIGRGSVPNALVTDAPLVTAPAATIGGLPAEPAAPIGGLPAEPAAPADANGAATVEPPALAEGLPTPVTR